MTAKAACIHKPGPVHKLPGMVLASHEFQVPLHYQRPEGEQLAVYARAIVSTDHAQKEESLPWLIFFQGGPGFQSPRPLAKSGWLKRALKDYRVLLLDQRGTGQSSPVTHESLMNLKTGAEQAEYLKHFRADNIVRDAESIRKILLGESGKWVGLGQSYGGFCLATYLSIAPEGLSAALITGGIPPATASIDDVYRATYKRVLGKNKLYYDRYPDDVSVIGDIVGHLQKHKVELPSGGTLSPRRFQQLGLLLGGQDGLATIHYAIETAFSSGQHLSYAFLKSVESLQSFDTNPIYALLHESIYCEGQASNWSADRLLGQHSEFDLDRRPFMFTGEMVYKSMFDDFVCLRPLREAAEILADYADWPKLYNLDKLRSNEVPCAAAMYYDDMYVERRWSEELAAEIPNLKIWVTSEFEHSGLRDDGERILDRLLGMVNGEI